MYYSNYQDYKDKKSTFYTYIESITVFNLNYIFKMYINLLIINNIYIYIYTDK